MGQVNSQGESRASETIPSLQPRPKVHTRPRKTAGFLGFSGPIGGRRECRPKASWRRERNCRRTLSAAFSMTYKPHKSWWMLTRESRACFGVLSRCNSRRAVWLCEIAYPRTADVSEDDADRGALVAQPETPAPCPTGGSTSSTGGGSPVRQQRTPGSVRGRAQSPSLSRLREIRALEITLLLVGNGEPWDRCCGLGCRPEHGIGLHRRL